MTEPTSAAKKPQPEEVFSALGLPPKVRRRAADALLRLVDDRIRAVVQAGQYTAATVLMQARRYPEETLGGGVQRAEEEGQRLKREVLSRPEMLTPESAAARASVSRQALDLRRKKHQALALAHVKRGFRYPSWQFDDSIAASMTRMLAALSDLDPWGQYFFLVEPEPLLGGRTPLGAVRAGHLDKVLRVIERLRADEAA